MNTDKANQLGDFLSLFNYPGQPVAQPMGNPNMPVIYAQQVAPGQAAAPPPVQGMVQIGAQPQAPAPAYPALVPTQQYAAPAQLDPLQYAPSQQYTSPVVPVPVVPAPVVPVPVVPVVNIGQPAANGGHDDLLRQNQAYRSQLAGLQAAEHQRTATEQEVSLANMKPMERLEARMQLLQQQNEIGADRAHQWRISSEVKDLQLRHNRKIDTSKLDTSSVEALQASVPTAVAAYADMEAEIAGRLRQELGMSNQIALEGLPPAPGSVGLPMSNRGGSVPLGPPTAGYNPAQHPMMMRDNHLQYTPQPQHGRVYQPQSPMPSPMPVAGGQMFPPSYPQPYQQYAQPQPQYGYPSPPVQLVPANQMPPQQVPGLAPQDAEMAKATARASIMAARRGGSAALAAQGLREPRGHSQALSMAGGQPNPNTMPDPTLFGPGQHPMHLASGGV